MPERGFSLEPIIHCVGIAKLKKTLCDSKKLRNFMKFMLRGAEPPDPRDNPTAFLTCVIACGLESLDQHQELDEVEFPDEVLQGKAFASWLAEQRRLYGDILQLTSITVSKAHELRQRALEVLDHYKRGEVD